MKPQGMYAGQAIVLRDYSWFLATCPDASYRNGRRAIELATESLSVDPTLSLTHDTLAAAYAEAGQFENAVKAQRQAIETALECRKPEFASRLKLYEAGQPYRDVPKTEVATTTVAK